MLDMTKKAWDDEPTSADDKRDEKASAKKDAQELVLDKVNAITDTSMTYEQKLERVLTENVDLARSYIGG